MCVRGADVIRDEVILKLKGKPLSVFSVYIPMVAGDAKLPADQSAKTLSKYGVKSYWDGDRKLGESYAKYLKLDRALQVAWDVYFVYGPEAVWGKTPPKPAYTMHQLKENDPLCLDGPKFRQAVEKELKKVKATRNLVLLTREGCGATAAMRKNLDTAGLAYEVLNLATLPKDDLRRGYPTPTLLRDGKDVFGMAEPRAGADAPG